MTSSTDKRSEMVALAERCEQATGPDRRLEAEIYVTANGFENWKALTPTGNVAAFVPRYTASLDAAMTLVPEGCNWTLEPDAAEVRWMGQEDVEEAQGHLIGRDGKCTALALCAASLRATATRMEEDNHG